MVCPGAWPWSMRKSWDPSGSAARPSSSRWSVGGSAAKVRGCKCWRNRQRDSFGAYDLKVCTVIIVSVQWDEARFCIFVSYYHSIVIASAIYALTVVSCLCCCLLTFYPCKVLPLRDRQGFFFATEACSGGRILIVCNVVFWACDWVTIKGVCFHVLRIVDSLLGKSFECARCRSVSMKIAFGL